ncbi:MAG: YicC family protein [Gammaproteobacteria bacterium]|nr:YicC family protein [Gammaproteobacteria bacterium]MBT8123272.1 YicC family protein [Gammaproteobacteria bacterium]NNC67555.1 YicC family protein [Gammaproteobacteria bacterium]
MLCSMTGFARVEDVCDQGNVSWEIRSVNHRYLEINFRLPEEVRRIEPQLRKFLQSKLARGKVDCTFRYQLADAQAAALELNEPLLDSLIKQINHVNEKLPQATPAEAVDLLSWPGVVRTTETDMNSFHATCIELFKTATEQLVDMRGTEGERLKNMLQERCEEIANLVKKVRIRYPQVLEAIKQKQQQRIDELNVEMDQQRFEQELVYASQKLDVAEELDRLDSHLVEMQTIFDRKNPIGRRLDFLMQEFNREANTLASKSADIETTQAAVDLKVLIEQMREQVQNIE